MDQILAKGFDFSIRVIELAKYLEEENKPFPLSQRLLACGTGIGISLRLAESSGGKSAENISQALSYAVETGYLLEIMVKTGYLTEKQCQPMTSDCERLRALITELLNKTNEGIKKK